MPSKREKRTGPAAPADPARFVEAVRAFRRKDPITDDEIHTLDATERERAFWVAGVAEADVVQQVYDAIDAAVEKGTPIAEFRAAVEDDLFEAWGHADSPRVETIFRTNVNAAQNAGRYEIMTAPEVLDARPFWRFDAIHDSRTDEDCDKCDGVVLPADDPWWKTHHPILHPNCRCQAVPLTAEEAADEGLTEKPPEVDVADGFGGVPSVTGDDWVPDLGGYDDDIAAALKVRFGF